MRFEGIAYTGYIKVEQMFLQIAAHRILKYCLRGLLGKQQCNTLFFVLGTLTDVLAESMKVGSLPKLQDEQYFSYAGEGFSHCSAGNLYAYFILSNHANAY